MPDDDLPQLDSDVVERIVKAALDEDGARNDVTTSALVPPEQLGRAVIMAKEAGVVAGFPVAQAVFAALDDKVEFAECLPEGAVIEPGDQIATIEGPLAAILSGERVALNFLQQLSGVATATHQLVMAVAGLPVKILDTRKTSPGLRVLERYAVQVGGGTNHRFNLSDGLLIKDNHIAAATDRDLSFAQIIGQARENAPDGMLVVIEVTNVDEARQALDGGADVVLLDNMSVADMRQAVQDADGRALTEASGSITIENVREIAETGVDRISIGALTHSAPALDLSLELLD
jgi:nicotinate-nucleotide pyrophosphorylase (carboxylating)